MIGGNAHIVLRMISECCYKRAAALTAVGTAFVARRVALPPLRGGACCVEGSLSVAVCPDALRETAAASLKVEVALQSHMLGF